MSGAPIPPGWYRDQHGRDRWWDGQRWDESASLPAPTRPLPPRPAKQQGGVGRRRRTLVLAAVSGCVVVLAVAGGVTWLVVGSDGESEETPAQTEPTPPTDASEEDFCSSIDTAFEDIAAEGEKEGDDEIDVSGAIEELESTGTPEDIPEDARSGYEAFIEALNDVNGETVDDAEDIDDPTEGDDGEAFGTYYAETCA